MEARGGAIEAPGPFARRAARARALAGRYPAAADILGFYAKLAEYQASLLDAVRGPSDIDALARMTEPFLDWLAREAPPALARAADGLRARGEAGWRLLHARAFTDPDQGETEDHAAMFVAEALVQPWAERAAMASDAAGEEPVRAPARCPSCGCPPVAGVLREEGHGARRSLVCVRCATEWWYERVACPQCGEREFDALPVYTAAPFDHVRIDACDRCHRYVKTIDLTKDGLAVPQVDDLASLPLDLWARDRGYVRIRSNLLRT